MSAPSILDEPNLHTLISSVLETRDEVLSQADRIRIIAYGFWELNARKGNIKQREVSEQDDSRGIEIQELLGMMDMAEISGDFTALDRLTGEFRKRLGRKIDD